MLLSDAWPGDDDTVSEGQTVALLGTVTGDCVPGKLASEGVASELGVMVAVPLLVSVGRVVPVNVPLGLALCPDCETLCAVELVAVDPVVFMKPELGVKGPDA